LIQKPPKHISKKQEQKKRKEKIMVGLKL